MPTLLQTLASKLFLSKSNLESRSRSCLEAQRMTATPYLIARIWYQLVIQLASSNKPFLPDSATADFRARSRPRPSACIAWHKKLLSASPFSALVQLHRLSSECMLVQPTPCSLGQQHLAACLLYFDPHNAGPWQLAANFRGMPSIMSHALRSISLALPMLLS